MFAQAGGRGDDMNEKAAKPKPTIVGVTGGEKHAPLPNFLCFIPLFHSPSGTGIASGKSTVCHHLKALGASVVDADLLGHSAYAPGTTGFESVVKEFGQKIVGVDGTVNRKALGAIVFSEPSHMKRLTDIVWPIIWSNVQKRVAELKTQVGKA